MRQTATIYLTRMAKRGVYFFSVMLVSGVAQISMAVMGPFKYTSPPWVNPFPPLPPNGPSVIWYLRNKNESFADNKLILFVTSLLPASALASFRTWNSNLPTA